jgi:hypothetical protein
MENHSLESKLVGCGACTKPSIRRTHGWCAAAIENNNELVLLSDAMELCNVSTIKSMVLAWFLFESSIESKASATLQPLPLLHSIFPTFYTHPLYIAQDNNNTKN